jgi:hypothetical protein
MPRLNVPIGPNGPIVEIRLCVGLEHAKALAAAGRPVPQPSSVPGLVDTGAELSAIQRSLVDWMGIPFFRFLDARSSVLGDESRVAPVYRILMTFGPVESPDPPKWRTIEAVGVNVVSPRATVLIGRDLLATCRFTYDGRKQRLMLSY